MPHSVVPFAPAPDRHYYVEGWMGWFVIHCRTKAIARRWGVQEFGRGKVSVVRAARSAEVGHYARWTSRSVPLPFEEAPE